VIDKKPRAELRAGMNIDSSLRMSQFRDDTGNDWRTEFMKRVRDAMMDYGFDAGKAQNHFFGGLGRGIAFISCTNIPFECLIELRELLPKITDNFLGRKLSVALSSRLIDKRVLSMNLLDEDVQPRIELIADEKSKRIVAMIESPGMTRKQSAIDVVDRVLQSFGVRQWHTSITRRHNAPAAAAGFP
jgi:hypothetical protein